MLKLDLILFGGRGASYYAKQGVEKYLHNEDVKRGKVYPIDISKWKNLTMEEAEDKIRDRKREVALIYDAKGNLIAGYQGNQGSVNVPISMYETKNGTFTHNHPKASAYGFGGTLSDADVNGYLGSKLKSMRAVASGKGEKNYILSKGRNARPSAFKKQFKKDMPTLETQMVDNFKKTYKKVYNQTGNKSKALLSGRQAQVGVLNRYYKDTAKKYGYNYRNQK